MPTGTEGVSLWVRKPFEKYAVTDFDNPFTSRFDECDAMVIFDNVKVPWERVFLLDDVQQSREMYFGTPSHVMGNHQSVVRYHEKLKIILGFAYKAAEMSSVLQVPAVRETLSKLAIAEAGLKGWIAGQIEDAETFGPYLHVNRRGLYSALHWCTNSYYQITETVREMLGAGPFQMPADVSVLSDSMLRETFERYWAAGEASAIDRFKFMKLAWDYLGSEFARCRGGLPMHLCQIGTKSLTVGLFCRSLPIRHFQLGWSPAMKKLTLETTAPFQGLPELVAYDEGLFEREGLQIGWADRNKGNKFDPVATNILSPKGLNPFLSHGKMLEDGQADMYNACEWGNYCRVEETAKASRQVGRRAILTYGAIAVGPKSSVYTPQQLADVTVAVPFYFGTHYLALQLLEGFLPRHMIKVCSAPPPSYSRLKAILSGEVEAATLTEPHISLAEKLGCRIICSAFYHGTEVASERVDGETYAAFNRAVREAVRRINANKAAYMHYFIDYHVQKGETDVALLKVADLREGRLVVADPAPIPVEELQRTAEWLKSWGMLEKTESPAALVDDGVQGYAHIAAE